MICARCGHARDKHENTTYARCTERDGFQHCTCYAFVAPHGISSCCLKGMCGADRYKQAIELWPLDEEEEE